MQPGSTGSVELRPAEPADEPFLRDVYASARADELERVPWSDEQKRAFTDQQFTAQDSYYREHYEGATYDVILVDGERAGRLYVARWPEEIRIMDITILPEFRGAGAGTRLLEELQAEARTGGKSLSIHVEGFNPAMRLYERLGFRPVEERGAYVFMEWRPAS
ncbi:MAG TPA: GNAT family N-acetyltransferase [Actinomycetota bacterium]|nr:GNAT family N-acetyltransferase [Actinomycetota bacterium]